MNRHKCSCNNFAQTGFNFISCVNITIKNCIFKFCCCGEKNILCNFNNKWNVFKKQKWGTRETLIYYFLHLRTCVMIKSNKVKIGTNKYHKLMLQFNLWTCKHTIITLTALMCCLAPKSFLNFFIICSLYCWFKIQ